MKILIAEDDLASRKFLFKFLSAYGDCDITVDGIKTLKAIRDIEKQKGVDNLSKAKVIMTTALNEKENVYTAFENGCEAFAAKPIDTQKLTEVMKKLELI